jgi:hypothetical protein
MKLPGELHNQIYELVFRYARLDNVVVINDLQRRKYMRGFRSGNYKLDRATKTYAKYHRIWNVETPAMTAWLSLPIVGISPIFETSILRACRQTQQEGDHFLGEALARTTFVYYVRFKSNQINANELPVPPHAAVKLSRVHRLRLEIQINPGNEQHFTPSDETWNNMVGRLFFLGSMTSLKLIEITVTINNDKSASQYAASFNNQQEADHPNHPAFMRPVIHMIPKEVEVTCGLAQESIDVGDHGGLALIDNAVLKRLYNMCKHEQGRYWINSSDYLNVTKEECWRKALTELSRSKMSGVSKRWWRQDGNLISTKEA